MKKRILSAVVVLAVVSSALAFKKSAPDVFYCNPSTKVCLAQDDPNFPTEALGYSTVDNDVIVTTPTITPFVNNGNLDCNPAHPTAKCIQYTGTIFDNQ